MRWILVTISDEAVGNNVLTKHVLLKYDRHRESKEDAGYYRGKHSACTLPSVFFAARRRFYLL